MGKVNNYPQAALDNVEPQAVRDLVTSLKELYDKGKPETDEELKQRVDEYFMFCQSTGIRPGIARLRTALHIPRTSFYEWSKGIGCSKERQEIIAGAKSLIDAFIEQCLLSGKINPASGIFIAKNWLGYKDSVSIEEALPQSQVKKVLTAAELPKLNSMALPQLSEREEF